jgi:hypothetical protein
MGSISASLKSCSMGDAQRPPARPYSVRVSKLEQKKQQDAYHTILEVRSPILNELSKIVGGVEKDG